MTAATTQSEETTLINKVRHIYQRITSLDSLKPSATVDAVFSELVTTCCRTPTPPPSSSFLDLTTLTPEVSLLRTNLISLCSQAESLLESHFTTSLLDHHHPLHHLHLFPYYTNYHKLTALETSLLLAHAPSPPPRVSFLGSGPLPLSSILMASLHLTSSLFLNYDRDPHATRLASTLLHRDDDLRRRVVFRTADVREVEGEFKGPDHVVFLAALVGMEKGEKADIIRHLWRNMDVGALLVVRSARGARGFLYPVVDAAVDLMGFDVLCQHHPDDEVVNSVIIARRR